MPKTQDTIHPSSNKQWNDFLTFIKSNIDEQSFRTWFTPAKFDNFDGKKLRIAVPSKFFYEYWEEHFIGVLRKALADTFGSGTTLIYVLQKEETTTIPIIQQPTPPTIKGERKYTTSSESMLDFLNKGKSFSNQDLDPHLNQSYTFENFIEGDSNKVARAVGLTVAQKFQDTFNPLFIFGSSGVGKTHLTNAIGTKMKELNPQKRVLYVSAHLLQIQYTDSVRSNKINDFMNFYQSIDTLIIDDIQEFAGKAGTQEVFFNIFNHLQHNHRQLIITCDCPPVQLEGMQERLLTRFNWGIVIELERPKTKLRKDIVNNRILRDGLPFPENVINYIANNVTESVRELEGVINSIMAYSVVYDCDVNMDLAEKTIARTVRVDNEPISIDKILEKVTKHYHISCKEIFSASRKKSIVQARQIAMYLTQKYTNLSSSQIGLRIGKRDHSTVLHACSQVEKRISVDKVFRAEVENIERDILKRK